MDYYKIKIWRFMEKWGEEEIKKLYPDKQFIFRERGSSLNPTVCSGEVYNWE